MDDKKVEARESQAVKANGFRTCLTNYIEQYAKLEQKSWEATKSVLDRYALPAFGDRPVSEIHRRDIKDLLEEVKKATPFQANQLRAHLSGMFRWLLVEEELVEANPVTGNRQCVRYEPRKRALTDAEVVALWRAALKAGAPFGPPIRLLLLTGRRREEMSALRWDELDGDWACLPGSRMKNGRDYRAPLSAQAKARLLNVAALVAIGVDSERPVITMELLAAASEPAIVAFDVMESGLVRHPAPNSN